jgi:hypothetical protein
MSDEKPRHALSDAIDELNQMRSTITAGGDPFEGLIVRTVTLPLETPKVGPEDLEHTGGGAPVSPMSDSIEEAK